MRHCGFEKHSFVWTACCFFFLSTWWVSFSAFSIVRTYREPGVLPRKLKSLTQLAVAGTCRCQAAFCLSIYFVRSLKGHPETVMEYLRLSMSRSEWATTFFCHTSPFWKCELSVGSKLQNARYAVQYCRREHAIRSFSWFTEARHGEATKHYHSRCSPKWALTTAPAAFVAAFDSKRF